MCEYVEISFSGILHCVVRCNAYKNMCKVFLMLFCSVFMRKTWKPGLLKPVETRSFHVFLKIFGFTKKKKDFFTRVCRHCYGEKLCKKSEKTNKLYWVGALKSFDFFRQKTWFWVNSKSFYQLCKQNLSMLELKKMNNQIINFELKSKSYFKVF